jgi:hypothetical protein
MYIPGFMKIGTDEESRLKIGFLEKIFFSDTVTVVCNFINNVIEA